MNGIEKKIGYNFPLTLPKRLCRNGQLFAEQVVGFLAFRMRVFWVRGKGTFKGIQCFYELGATELNDERFPL